MKTRLLLCFVLVQATPAFSGIVDLFPGEDLRAALLGLSAGDELVIHAGTYSTQSAGGSFFLQVAWNGTPSQPIIIRSALGARPVIQGDASQNVLNIDGAHFVMRGLAITGGSHGLRLGSVNNATFEDLVIHDVADVGISCNRPGNSCDSLLVHHNEIYNTGMGGGPGEGMYIGCNNAGCVVSNSVFSQNYLHHLSGSQADGIEIKSGSYGNLVKDNVIIGANFPGITMYGFTPGPGRNRNVVEGNFVANTADNGIQLVGQVMVRSNVVVSSGNNGIQSKPSQGFVPLDLEILHNTVYQAGDACFKANDWGGLNIDALVANNAFYCSASNAVRVVGGDGQAVIAGNIALGGVSGIAGGVTSGNSVTEDLANPLGLDLWPTATSALLDAGVPQHAAADFNGVQPSSSDVDAGAYQRIAQENPGWQPQMGFKTLLEPIFSDGFEIP